MLSLLAMAGAIGAAVYSPGGLLQQQVLAGGLALMPALLLAHYRGWPNVTLLLGGGLVVLSLLHLFPLSPMSMLHRTYLVPLVLAPYIAIALGAGWFGEVRRYQAELRATQLQLIQSEKLDSIGRIAAGVAHEVKNPLMIVLTGTKILSKRLAATGDASTRIVLNDMVEAVERADRIIGALLSYARDEGLNLAAEDLNGVIEKSLLLVKHEIDSHGTVVVRSLEPELPPLMLDVFKVEQVLVNVITNALHAMERNGELHIRTTHRRLTDDRGRDDAAIVLHIEDTGPGIAAAHLNKVFDPFFTTKPAGSGTGLGLSVSRQIIEMHGGTIDIRNRDVGGAQVTITFKLSDGGQQWHEKFFSSMTKSVSRAASRCI
jgi:signal transduction histidine kinase